MHSLINQGETNLDALNLPTLAVTSKNEGKSVLKVWAFTTLNVKGEGESTMYYRGNPAISQTVNGSSRLIKLP